MPPDPLVIVRKLEFDVAVQVQLLAVAVTLTDPVPPPTGTEADNGFTANEHVMAADWLTVSVWSAIRIVPLRGVVPLNAAAVKGILPGPLLLAFGFTVSQLSLTVEDQKQPDCVFTSTLRAPPAPGAVRGLGFRE